MCLYIKDIQKQVATEPLKVYKVLDINDKPPYYPTDAYHVGINCPGPHENIGKYWVGAGYLHAYTDKERAVRAAKNIWGGYSNALETGTIKYKIVEMYIPKGTAYYWNQSLYETAAEALEWKPDSPVEIGEVEYVNEDLPF